ncbi:MAG: hypothetical protein MUF18_02525 [Fimbriiglobus sp.]|nr:hypothetical protein [Fimbriiglobus sp.]
MIVKHPKLLGIGIDESTAVVVSGGTAKVIGDGVVQVFDGKAEPVKRKAGDRFAPTRENK